MSIKIITKQSRIKFHELAFEQAFITSFSPASVYIKILPTVPIIGLGSGRNKVNALQIYPKIAYREFQDGYEIYPAKIIDIAVETT